MQNEATIGFMSCSLKKGESLSRGHSARDATRFLSLQTISALTRKGDSNKGPWGTAFEKLYSRVIAHFLAARLQR